MTQIEAIVLLEKAKQFSGTTGCSRRIDQVIAILKQPCKICGGKGKVPDGIFIPRPGDLTIGPGEPCPDCQQPSTNTPEEAIDKLFPITPEQPPTGAFTELVRLNVNNWEEAILRETQDIRVVNIIKWLREACDRLDRAEARIKAMYAGDLSPESRLNAHKVVIDNLRECGDELREEIHTIRPYADCYKRVCEFLGIEKDILGFVENLESINADLLAMLSKIKDQANRATMVQDRSVGIIKQTCGYIFSECVQAIAKAKEKK